MSDEELDLVLAAARTVPRDKRAAFLQALGYALEHSNDIGHGVVPRAIMSVKRDVLGPPATVTMILR